MPFPFRIVRASRLEAVERIEQEHCLNFMRDALKRAIEQVEIDLILHRKRYQAVSRNPDKMKTTSSQTGYGRLVALRLDLKACLSRIGGHSAQTVSKRFHPPGGKQQ